MPSTDQSDYPHNYPFLQGGGEMGSLIRQLDWSGTPLGEPGKWPDALKLITGTMLSTPSPILICWGPDYIQLYNDAFRPINGSTKHPQALGGSARNTYAEIWDTIGPMFAGVMNGQAVGFPDFKVPLDRNGYLEDCYFDFSYSPIKDADGVALGVLVICLETTDKIIALEELQKNNDRLTESEDRFKTMAEGTDILIAIGDETGNATYFNKAWTELTGRSTQDLLEFGWVDLVHPEDKNRVISTFTAAFAEKKPFTWEFRVLSKKGDYRWLLVKGPPRFRPDGTFAGYISSCVDITDRKHREEEKDESANELIAINEEMAAGNEELSATNEELTATRDSLNNLVTELAESEERFRTLVLQAPVGICMLKGDPLCVEVINDTFLELVRKKRSDFDNRSYWEAIPEAAAYYEPITRNVVETGEPYYASEHEIILLRDGVEEKLFVDFVYQPIKNPDETVDTILIVANEITEQVNARKKVERTEESLRMAIDAAELGSYFINAKDRIFAASPRLKEFFGYGPDEEVLYEAAINQIHPDYRQKAADQVEAAFTTGVKFDMEYPVIGHNDGKIRWVRGIGTVQHDSNGTDTYFTGVLHEITEKKLDEIRKSDFIGMVSHELKTPLTSLSAIVQVLYKKLKTSDDPFIAGALDKAQVQVKKMGNMINGFLNISRLESGKIHINKLPFIMGDLIREVVEEINITGVSNIIEIKTCEKVMVKADRDKIGSVLSNLLSNAIKYSPKASCIEINCSLQGKNAQVSVTDEGLGVRSEDAAKIFERYYRVESSNTQHISGFGIGLYLSAEIIQRHDGKIWLESQYGKGSTFYFSLPLA
jgi:two-component system sensor histidine kinase VicK